MKMTLCKRIAFLLLAAVLCLGCAACSKEKSEPATKDELLSAKTGDEGLDAIPIPNTTVEEEFIDELPDEEMLGKIGAWRGMADSGTLPERDQYTLVNIKSKKDLDPYREHLSNFTEEDEKKIFSDDGGACVLLELTAANENILHGTSSIVQAGNTITIIISTDEVEDVLPKYTFFLLYFPAQYYNGEVIDVVF